jgi:hypothetical protein
MPERWCNDFWITLGSGPVLTENRSYHELQLKLHKFCGFYSDLCKKR